jgi:two-component system, cell cycle sensor histidine kinase and response regulator CckA
MENRYLDESSNSENALRHSAEEKLSKSSYTMPEVKDKTPEEIIHELQVHQIELEMQNEELKRVKLELEQCKDKYQDLYHFAPTGYFTLTRKGIIQEVNLTGAALLGIPRGKLIGRGFGHFVAPESLDQWDQHILGEVMEGDKQLLDLWIETEHGSTFFAHLESVRKAAPREPNGQNDGEYLIHVVVSDITDRKMAEESLRGEKDKLKSILDHMVDGVYILSTNYDIEYLNPALASERGDIAGRKCFDYLAGLTEPCPWCKNQQVFNGESLVWERTSINTGKTYDIFETPIRNSDGSISKLSILHDITRRKEAEKSLKETTAFLNTLLNAIPAPIFYKDTDARYIGFNKSFEEFFGQKEEELVGKSVFDMYPSKFAEIFHAKDIELFNNPGVQVYESQLTNAEGVVHDVVFHKSTFEDSQGNVIGMIGVILDITERKLSEITLRESERFLRQSEKIARTGGWKANPFTDSLYWTEGVYDICEAPKYYQPGLDEGLEFYTEPYRPVLKEAIAKTIDRGEPFAIEAEVITTTGKRLWTEVRGLMRVEEGEEPQVVGSFLDITDRKMAESDRKRLSTAIEQAAEGVVITDPDGIIQYVNPAEEKISGYSCAELIGQGAAIFKGDNHDEDLHRNLWETINTGRVWSGKFINKKKDGAEYHEEATISPVYDMSGSLTNFVAVKHDVTKQLALQEQLFQSQKMEAIGTLAGGFAHDFNNKLQVIDGYVDLVLSNKDLPETVKSDLEAVRQTVESSAELIKGMMVFSRKTSVKLEPFNLNKIVMKLRTMLVPVMPRVIDIDLVETGDLWTINASPSQIDQILMNLAINARDAMPDGGKLIIKTQNTMLDEEFCRFYPGTNPGNYVLLSVADTGKGMDQETLKHIFEPFFTTKEQGKGTGLGLSVVYGIVEKHGGKIICDSEPSVGTTFRIYFPAIGEISEDCCTEKQDPTRRQAETILLVDDEPSFLAIVSRTLNRSKYEVITASNGQDALELYEKHRERIRLVILDLIMPGMDGRECLQALRNMDPKVRVLVASGGLKPGMEESLKGVGARGFIGKPFDMPQLLEQIRKIIDEG